MGCSEIAAHADVLGEGVLIYRDVRGSDPLSEPTSLHLRMLATTLTP